MCGFRVVPPRKFRKFILRSIFQHLNARDESKQLDDQINTLLVSKSRSSDHIRNVYCFFVIIKFKQLGILILE